MATVLLLYASREGQTIRIAERLASALASRGHQPEVRAALPFPALGGADGLVVAASVHGGRHPRALVRALRAHRAVLQHLPSAFLSVCLCAAVPDEPHRALADSYLRSFLTSTDWRPDLAGSVAGALRFDRYGPVKRRFMRNLARHEGLPVASAEFTDWGEVRAFAEAFADLVELHPGPRHLAVPAGSARGARPPGHDAPGDAAGRSRT